MPTPRPNLRFDIDALFDHLINNLGDEPGAVKDWHFSFRSDDLPRLERIGESLADDFEVHLQEEVETIENDRRFMGPPLLQIITRGPLGPDEVKALAGRFSALAAAEGITYDGVSSHDPIDEDEMFGWLDLEAAVWRLRHFTDTGLEPGEPIPWVFAVDVSDAVMLESAAAAFEHAGFTNLERVDDEEEGTGLLVRCDDGRNDDAALERRYQQIQKIAAAAGAELLGVQFFEGDEGEGFDDDEDDDDEE